MKKLLIATAAVALVTVGTASAADLAYKAPPPPPPAPTWTGCYVDAGVGYGFYNQSHYAETDPGLVQLTPTANTAGEGWLGRVGGGCDYQVAPMFVIGAFADYDFMNLKGTFQESFSGLLGSESETASWAVGGRVGFLPYPNLMTFVSAGYTQAQFGSMSLSTDTVPSVATPFAMASNTYSGWFIGGGYEYRIPWVAFNGLYWKTEYRYASYQAADIPITPLTITHTAEHMQKDTQTVTTSLVWKFSWGGPVVAKY